MLPKSQRLSAGEGKIEGGVAFRSPYLLIKARAGAFPHNRYAVVLGAKVSPSSVRRHFLKRRVMDALRFLPDSFGGAGYDMIIIVSSRIATIAKERLRDELRMAFDQAKKFFEKQ